MRMNPERITKKIMHQKRKQQALIEEYGTNEPDARRDKRRTTRRRRRRRRKRFM